MSAPACFMGSAEDIRAHHKLVADAKDQDAAEERALVVRWLRDPANLPSGGELYLAAALERGEHVR